MRCPEFSPLSKLWPAYQSGSEEERDGALRLESFEEGLFRKRWPAKIGEKGTRGTVPWPGPASATLFPLPGWAEARRSSYRNPEKQSQLLLCGEHSAQPSPDNLIRRVWACGVGMSTWLLFPPCLSFGQVPIRAKSNQKPEARIHTALKKTGRWVERSKGEKPGTTA